MCKKVTTGYARPAQAGLETGWRLGEDIPVRVPSQLRGSGLGPRALVLSLALLAQSVLLVAPVCAQGSPPTTPPPGAVPQPSELQQRVLPRPADAPLTERPAPPRELGKPADELTLDVTRYAVADDAPAALRDALPRLTAGFAGKGRSYEDLVNAVAAVTRYLQRDLGYYLGYAYLPEQAPQDGVVQIAVLEGRLDQITLVWPDKAPVDRAVVEAYLARLKPGEILRVRDVERVVFLVNDLRGITASFEVKAGRRTGTASFVVTVQPESRWSARAEVDSLGSRYSGVWRVSALGNVASPLGRGDGLVLNVLSSVTGGLQFVLGGYTLPVGSDGLKVGLSSSYVRYKLDADLLADTDLSGDATAVTAYALYPVMRSRNLNLFGLVSYDWKRFNDKLFGATQQKTSQDLQVAASGDFRDDLLSGGVNTFEAIALYGRMERPPGSLNDNPDTYTVARINGSRLQNLISNRLLLLASLKSQYAFQNLDSTEQFQLGGPDRVRAFGPGEGTGDSGIVGSLELRFLPPEAWFGRLAREFVFSAFYDVGTVQFRHDATQQLQIRPDFVNRSTLQGVGLGVVWDRPRDFALRLSLAFPVSGEAVNDEKKSPRIYFTANKSF